MDDAKLERLRSVPAFARCDDRTLAELGAIADDVDVEAGTTVVTQGSTVRHMYLLVDGRAEVTVDGESVATIDAGEVVGELAMFDPAPSSATVTMLDAGELLVIEHRRFESVVRANPDLAISLLRTIARRFHNLQESVAETG